MPVADVAVAHVQPGFDGGGNGVDEAGDAGDDGGADVGVLRWERGGRK